MASVEEPLFYLQNQTAGYLGNSPVFWGVDGAGYTSRLDRAKKFTYEEAQSIMRSTKGSHSWFAWPVDHVDKHAHLTVDIQDLRTGE